MVNRIPLGVPFLRVQRLVGLVKPPLEVFAAPLWAWGRRGRRWGHCSAGSVSPRSRGLDSMVAGISVTSPVSPAGRGVCGGLLLGCLLSA